mgnify:CR=1 FL=1
MRDMVVLVELNGACCRSMARKLRAEHIYCKILPATATAEEILAQDPLGVLLAGGDTGEPAVFPEGCGWTKTGLPLLAMGDAALGLCLALGGSLTPREDTPRVVQITLSDRHPALFDQVETEERYLAHPRCMVLCEGMEAIVQSPEGVLGLYQRERKLYGMAFQVEQNDPDGVQLLVNFCRGLCGCTPWWSNQAFAERAVEEIRRCVGEGEAVCALSGGVDSGVCALLGNMAIGSRLHCIFVDTGLLRKGEGDRVMSFYKDTVGLNLTRVDAGERFLTALKGVRRAEEKEQIIFRLLNEELEKVVSQLGNVRILLQGTNYSDTLAAGTLFPLNAPEHGMQVIEPVRELFKDEIRRVGEELGLPPIIIQRQPFPGSGLALRILSDVTEEKLDILREADAIFRGEIEETGQSKRLWQYFATLADNPAEDGRNMVVTLRAVQVCEGSAAMAARLPYDLLEKVVQLIRERVPQVRRVVYDLTPSSNYKAVEWR